MKKIASFSLILLVLLVMAACGSPAPSGELPETPPESIVDDFYAWYLGERSTGPKNPHDSSAISADLLARYDEGMQSALPGNGISFVCAQDFPDSVTVTGTQINDQQAQVTVASSFGNSIELTLINVDGSWQINDVICQ